MNKEGKMSQTDFDKYFEFSRRILESEVEEVKARERELLKCSIREQYQALKCIVIEGEVETASAYKNLICRNGKVSNNLREYVEAKTKFEIDKKLIEQTREIFKNLFGEEID